MWLSFKLSLVQAICCCCQKLWNPSKRLSIRNACKFQFVLGNADLMSATFLAVCFCVTPHRNPHENWKAFLFFLFLSCLFIFLPFFLGSVFLSLLLCLSVYILRSLSLTNTLSCTHTAPQCHEISSCPINRCRRTRIEHVSLGAVLRWRDIHHAALPSFPYPTLSWPATLPPSPPLIPPRCSGSSPLPLNSGEIVQMPHCDKENS